MAEKSEEAGYQLSLKGPGITIEKLVDARTASAIAQMSFGGHFSEAALSPVDARLAVAQTRSGGIGAAVGVSQRLSLREYLQLADTGRGIHGKILAVGRYIRDLEDQPDFAREDIRSRFRSAGEPQPANFSRDFQKAVRAGWIAEDPKSRGRYYVTRTGDEEIDDRQGNSAAPIRVRRRRKRMSSATTTLNDE